MKNNPQGFDQLNGAELAWSKLAMRLISLRAFMTTILLLAMVGSDAVVMVTHADAQSACGVLFACPTSTPTPESSPMPTPTPESDVIVSPTPSLQPSVAAISLPALTPTATTSAPPTVVATATPIQIRQTPVPGSIHVPVAHKKDTGGLTADRLGESGFLHLVMIIAVIFICLLVILILGLFIFRRMLLPSINVRTPADNVSSWTRTFTPHGMPNEVEGR